MAINSYGKALASMAKESVTGSVKRFGSDIKSAVMSELPAFTGAAEFARSLRKEAEKIQKDADKSNDEVKTEVKKQIKEQKVTNSLTQQMTGLLRSINQNTSVQTRLMAQQSKFDRQNRLFSEEEARERKLQEKKLLDVIKKSGGGGGSGTGTGGEDSSGGLFGFLRTGLFLATLVKALKSKAVLAALATIGLIFSSPAQASGGGQMSRPRRNRGPSNSTSSTESDGVFPTPQSSRQQGKRGPKQPSAKPGSSSTSSTQRGEFIRQKEGLRLNAYQDAGKYAIGYGYNIQKTDIERGYIDLGDGQKISVSGEGGRNTQITNEQAEILFQLTLATKEKEIISQIGANHYNKLSEDQKEAILSYYYNVGKLPGKPGEFAAAIKTNKFGEARELISKGITTSQGKVLPALQQRRKAEAELFGNFKSSAKQGRGSSQQARTAERNKKDYKSHAQQLAEFYGGGQSFTTSGGNRDFILPTSGSEIAREYVIPTKDSELIGLAETQNDYLKSISSSSGKSSKIATTQERRYTQQITRREKTPEEKRIERLEKANQRFLDRFQKLTTDKIQKPIEKALQPYLGAVTLNEAGREGYRGQVASDLLKTSKFFEKTFGKEYGPIFNELGQEYLEYGLSNIGENLFAGVMGEDAVAFTGQILGNVKAGKGKVALEQALYGMTGVASGVETVMAKYGFRDPKDAIRQTAGILGGGVTDIVRQTMPMVGPRPQQTTYYDPITRQNVPISAGNIFDTPFGKQNLDQPTTVKVNGQNALLVHNTAGSRPGVSMGAAASGAISSSSILTMTGGSISSEAAAAAGYFDYGYGEDIKTTADTLLEQNELVNEWGEEHSRLEIQNTAVTARVGMANARATVASANQTGNILTRGFASLGNIFSSSGRGGPSGTIPGSPGQAGSQFGNFLFDMGSAMISQRLTSGIKDPYLQQLASFGMMNFMQGGDMSKFGSMAAFAPAMSAMMNPKASKLDMAGGILSTVGHHAAIHGVSGMAAGVGNVVGFLGGDAIGATASASNVLGAAAPFLPYAGAVTQAIQGDVKGAAKTAAGVYIGTAIAGPIGGMIGSFFSDERLKKDIVPLANLSNGLTLYKYKWKNESVLGSGEQIGYMAQEVEKLYPSAVSEVAGIKTINVENLNNLTKVKSGGIGGSISSMIGSAFGGNSFFSGSTTREGSGSPVGLSMGFSKIIQRIFNMSPVKSSSANLIPAVDPSYRGFTGSQFAKEMQSANINTVVNTNNQTSNITNMDYSSKSDADPLRYSPVLEAVT